jgi:protein phosphatase
VSDAEIGAVASVLPPAEACRFLIDLANMRGGPDNITVVIVRLGGSSAEANGVVSSVSGHRRALWQRMPWWPAALLGGTLLAMLAIYLEIRRSPVAAGSVFVLAFAAIVGGLVGLFLQYRRERLRAQTEDEELPAPRIHRHAICRVEPALLERLTRAVKGLRQHADEKHWTPDWKAYEEHFTAAEGLLNQGDLSGAFREYCRAMLPLTRALHKQRNKEEKFQPIFWDRSH